MEAMRLELEALRMANAELRSGGSGKKSAAALKKEQKAKNGIPISWHSGSTIPISELGVKNIVMKVVERKMTAKGELSTNLLRVQFSYTFVNADGTETTVVKSAFDTKYSVLKDHHFMYPKAFEGEEKIYRGTEADKAKSDSDSD